MRACCTEHISAFIPQCRFPAASGSYRARFLLFRSPRGEPRAVTIVGSALPAISTRLPGSHGGNGGVSHPIVRGADAYARAGGLASRVEGLALSLTEQGFETHLWFIGDPEAPGEELWRGVHLHRWCQWISRHEPAGVYSGEEWKRHEYATSLPPRLFQLQE